MAAAGPGAAVTHAQPEAAAAVSAAGHGAVGQPDASVQLRAGVGKEAHQVGAPARAPTVGVPAAKPVLPARPVAAGHHAGWTAQHRVIRCGNIDLDTELRSHRRQQLGQQPSTDRRRAPGRSAHSRTSRPVNQPAACKVLRASSTVRWP